MHNKLVFKKENFTLELVDELFLIEMFHDENLSNSNKVLLNIIELKDIRQKLYLALSDSENKEILFIKKENIFKINLSDEKFVFQLNDVKSILDKIEVICFLNKINDAILFLHLKKIENY